MFSASWYVGITTSVRTPALPASATCVSIDTRPTIFALPTVRSSDARDARPAPHGPARGGVVPAVHHGPRAGLPGHPGRRPLRRPDRLRGHRPAVHERAAAGPRPASARSSVRSWPPAASPSSRSWSSGPWPSGAPSRTGRYRSCGQRPSWRPAERADRWIAWARPASSTSRWVISRTTPGAIVPARTPFAARWATSAAASGGRNTTTLVVTWPGRGRRRGTARRPRRPAGGPGRGPRRAARRGAPGREPGGRDHARLAHRAAEPLALVPGLVHERRPASASTEPTGAPKPLDRQVITVVAARDARPPARRSPARR